MTIVRAMRSDDADAVMRIYQAGILKGTATFDTDCPPFERWDKTHLPCCRLAAEADGRLCGFAALSAVSARHCYRGVAELSVYVDPRFQGRGVGKALLKALVEDARQQGFWTLQATVIAVNQPSIALHHALGFRTVGIRERIAQDRFGAWQDTLLLALRL